MKLLLPLALSIASSLALSSCASQGLTSIEPAPPAYRPYGVEVQVYPAGIIPGLHARYRLSDADTLTFRLAANLTDRQDFGEREDESGDGWGSGVGWRRALSGDLDETGWYFGARVDVWDLSIDWRDRGRSGTTDIIVLQPTAEGGYGWTTERAGRFELGLGLGAEINVDTQGEDVGEGAILLLGLTWLP
ncbi:MAG: hypothetical protein AAF957_07530 [Planctomycetota bacterium]